MAADRHASVVWLVRPIENNWITEGQTYVPVVAPLNDRRNENPLEVYLDLCAGDEFPNRSPMTPPSEML